MNQLRIILIYFVLDRSLSGIYYLQNDLIVNQVYTSLGKIVGLYYFIKTIHLLYKEQKLFRYLTPILGMMLTMFVSTLIHDGSLSRWLQAFYPICLMIPFLYTQLQSKVQTSVFLDAISSLYLFVGFLNLVQICFFPHLYSDDIWGAQIYLLGGENHVQYPLMIGLLFNLLNQYVNGKAQKTILYSVMHITSTFIVFSATSLVACLICMLCIYFKYFEIILYKIRMIYILYALACVFFVIVCLGGTGIFESTYMAPILEMLGKDSTLSGRTYVWMTAMLQFFKNPILGNGFSDTANILDVWIVNANGVGKYYTLSSHNQFLQTLVEGGVVAIVMLFVFLQRIGNYIDKVHVKLSVLIKSCIIAFLILLMGEAGGWYNLWFVSIMGVMFGTLHFQSGYK